MGLQNARSVDSQLSFVFLIKACVTVMYSMQKLFLFTKFSALKESVIDIESAVQLKLRHSLFLNLSYPSRSLSPAPRT